MKTVIIAAGLAVFGTASLSQEREAAVVQFNGYSVTIQSFGLLGYVPDEIKELAQRMCVSAGKEAEYQSGYNVNASVVSYFFTCL